MNTDNSIKCPQCGSSDTSYYKKYQTIHNGCRQLLICDNCAACFSETSNTPMENLKTRISKVASALKLRSEGMGLRAAGRILQSHKNTVSHWENQFASQKETLMLYSFCHEFISLTFEGDEICTIVNSRTDPADSRGRTAVIIDRVSRFIADQKCGNRDASLFRSVVNTVCKLIDRTKELSFLSDGERRYGNILFELCSEALKTGKRGRPAHVLPEGVRVRIKNKGGQKHKRGRNRPKYQAPQREHPNTDQNFPEKDIHANHLEAHNASIRRRNSAFKRRTNMYAKNRKGLQRPLDVHQLIHNFVRPHWTAGEVPAVSLGILNNPLSIEDILTIQRAAWLQFETGRTV